MIPIEIIEITVLVNKTGTDKILLKTNLPNPEYPFTGYATIMLTTASETGEDYVKKHFSDVPRETILI